MTAERSPKFNLFQALPDQTGRIHGTVLNIGGVIVVQRAAPRGRRQDAPAQMGFSKKGLSFPTVFPNFEANGTVWVLGGELDSLPDYRTKNINKLNWRNR
jgi:hypothetical protein